MKLLILLSIVACSYGDKLDRTYLPPANAGSAGGSPGSLTAPGLSNFGTTGPAKQPLEQRPIGQPSRPNYFGQANQQTPGQQESGSLNFESNRPFGFTSGSGARKPSPVYGPADSRPNLGNNGFVSGFGPSNSQGDNQAQSLGISNSPNELGQQSFGPNAASPVGYSQINGQNFVGSSSQPESERPQAAADRNAEILNYVNENDGDRFNYRFETSNGITAEEAGVASGGVKAQGGYSYTGDDGKAYTITYTADEQGYQPQGEHLPTPPPIPEEILRSIEKNAQAAAAGTQEGAYRPEDYENEDNSQGYSGATSINKPQGQDQFSSQQYIAPIDKPASSQIGFQQTKPEFQNVPTSENNYNDRLTNGVSSFEPIRSSNVGSINQASRPQNTQDTKQDFVSQFSQSRPQFGSQIPSNSPFSKSGNGQALNPFNGASRPESQITPSGQDYFKPSQVSQYQQSGFKPTSNQPGQGPQSKLPSAQNYNQESSGYQYQPVNSGFGVTARPSFPNQPSFQNLDQGVTTQGGNQYQTNPSNKFSKRPSSNQPGQEPQSKLSPAQNYNQESSGYQYQPVNSGFGVTARPSFANQPSQPTINQGVTPQGGNQYQTNPSNKFSNRPSLNQQYQQNTQGLTPSPNGFNRPNGALQNQVSSTNLPLGFVNSIAKQTAPIQAPYQYQRPSQPFNQNQVSQNGFRQPTSQGQIPSGANEPAFGSPQTSYNQPIQSQGPLQSTFNQNSDQRQTNPSQIQGSSMPSFNRPTQGQGSKPVFPSGNQPEQFSGPRQPPSYNPDEGYKY
ncbi:pro-resilin-like isoform X2 [Pieris rapae]|uniref:pro-resilin-like isoform X2 n=1 Tax=Pieris rapae TaxID=64459 RepID=UPI001E280C62|nr:pro-resilin-like isoform X2 [Pieris rapae]